jgi:tRNA A37 threonylcarbamoyltransferase TsaD
MLRTLFDHVCGQIETLVQNQTDEVASNGLNVKSILLVGGFGSSKYLHHRLEKSYSSRGISVLQVDGALVHPKKEVFTFNAYISR